LLVSSGGVSQVQDLLDTVSVGALRGAELRDSELPFVAPEVLMGEAPSVAADLFTIGALAYTMATGSPPFVEPSLPQLLGAMLRERPDPLATLRPDVPAGFAAAITKTLSPVPTERPADARALGLMLP
jgi:serine/threonine protein kinase